MDNPSSRSVEAEEVQASAPPAAQDQSTSESLGDSSGPRRPMPPLSPLTGGYLLIVVGEPHSERHKEIILQKISKAFLSWDIDECHVSLEKELNAITGQAPMGEEAKYGERLIQYATENLVTEILIHPQLNTLHQCMKNLLSSFTKHRHIIHAGYTFAGNGSWILQDGTLSISDLIEALHEPEVLRVLKAYENSVSINVHCAPEGDWTTERFQKEPVTKLCTIRVNPGDVIPAGIPEVSAFIDYLSPFLEPANIQQLLQPTDIVGNIRFTHPTLYVFPGGQGDAALFGINGFNMLIDGGFARKACFWDFARHLDRLDAVLLTRLNNSTVNGISSVLQRKKMNHVYPQIGHFFCNLQDRKIALSPDGDKDKDSLIVNLAEEGQEIVANLRHLALKPHPCYRDGNQIDPVNLYHKVGHGKLDMYVISPARDSQAVKEFLAKWTTNDSQLFSNTGKKIGGKAFEFPLQNLVSICALLVWQPANPNDTITRILFPGSTPQHKIFEGLEKLRHLEFLKHPVCSVSSLGPTTGTGTTSHSLSKARQSRIIEHKQLENKTTGKIQVKQVRSRSEKTPSREIKSKLDTNKLADDKKEIEATLENSLMKLDNRILSKDEQMEKIKKEIQKIELGDNEEQKKKVIHRSKYDMRYVKSKVDSRAPSKSVDRKKAGEKKTEGDTSPPVTPKKANVNGTITKKEKAKVGVKPGGKTTSSPPITPAKSAKEANNRKVVEARLTRSTSKPATATFASKKKEETPSPGSVAAPKTDRKPISRRPKGSHSPASKSKTKEEAAAPRKIDEKPNVGDLAVATAVTTAAGKTITDLHKGAETEKTESQEKTLEKHETLQSEVEEQNETDKMAVNIQMNPTLSLEESKKSKEEQYEDEDGAEDEEVEDEEEEEEEEEYLIITKEESGEEKEVEDRGQEEPQTKDETEGEGEMKKLMREEKESEKKGWSLDENDRKGEPDEIEREADDYAVERKGSRQSDQQEGLKKEEKEVGEVEPELDTEPIPELKNGKTDQKDSGFKEHKEGESLPEEKVSNTLETSATTAPTLPEDEKVELDQVGDKEEEKAAAEEIVEEKYIQEETKEDKQKEIDNIEAQVPQTTEFINAEKEPTLFIQRSQKKTKEVVKTPDEVADLPVHEEVDPQMYSSGEYAKDIQKKISETDFDGEDKTLEDMNEEVQPQREEIKEQPSMMVSKTFKKFDDKEAKENDEINVHEEDEDKENKLNEDIKEEVPKEIDDQKAGIEDNISSKYLNIIDELEKSGSPPSNESAKGISVTTQEKPEFKDELTESSIQKKQDESESDDRDDLTCKKVVSNYEDVKGNQKTNEQILQDTRKSVQEKIAIEIECNNFDETSQQDFEKINSEKLNLPNGAKAIASKDNENENSGKSPVQSPKGIDKDGNRHDTTTEYSKFPSERSSPVDFEEKLSDKSTSSEVIKLPTGLHSSQLSGQITPVSTEEKPSNKSSPSKNSPIGNKDESGESSPIHLLRASSAAISPADFDVKLPGRKTSIEQENSFEKSEIQSPKVSQSPEILKRDDSRISSGKSSPVEVVNESGLLKVDNLQSETVVVDIPKMKAEDDIKETAPVELMKQKSGHSSPAPDFEEKLSGKSTPTETTNLKIGCDEIDFVGKKTSEPNVLLGVNTNLSSEEGTLAKPVVSSVPQNEAYTGTLTETGANKSRKSPSENDEDSQIIQQISEAKAESCHKFSLPRVDKFVIEGMASKEFGKSSPESLNKNKDLPVSGKSSTADTEEEVLKKSSIKSLSEEAEILEPLNNLPESISFPESKGVSRKSSQHEVESLLKETVAKKDENINGAQIMQELSVNIRQVSEETVSGKSTPHNLEGIPSRKSSPENLDQQRDSLEDEMKSVREESEESFPSGSGSEYVKLQENTQITEGVNLENETDLEYKSNSALDSRRLSNGFEEKESSPRELDKTSYFETDRKPFEDYPLKQTELQVLTENKAELRDPRKSKSKNEIFPPGSSSFQNNLEINDTNELENTAVQSKVCPVFCGKELLDSSDLDPRNSSSPNKEITASVSNESLTDVKASRTSTRTSSPSSEATSAVPIKPDIEKEKHEEMSVSVSRKISSIEIRSSDLASPEQPPKESSGKSTPATPGKLLSPVGGKPTSESVSMALADACNLATFSLEKENMVKSSSPSPVDISPLSLDEIKQGTNGDRSKTSGDGISLKTPIEKLKHEDEGDLSRTSSPDRSHFEKSDASIANGIESEDEVEKGILESKKHEKESQILDVSSEEEEELKGLDVDEDDEDDEEIRDAMAGDSGNGHFAAESKKENAENLRSESCGDIKKGEKDDMNLLVKVGEKRTERDPGYDPDGSDLKSEVKRMLVTASSEDGGTETEICIQGGVKTLKEVLTEGEEKLNKEEEEFSNLIMEARKEYSAQRSRKTSTSSAAEEATDDADGRDSVESEMGSDREELGSLLMQARQELAFVRSRSRETGERKEPEVKTLKKTVTIQTTESTRTVGNEAVKIITNVTKEKEEQEDGSLKVTTTTETKTVGGKDEGTVVAVNTVILSGDDIEKEELRLEDSREKDAKISCSTKSITGTERKNIILDENGTSNKGAEGNEAKRKSSTSSVFQCQEDHQGHKDSANIVEIRRSSTEMSPLKTTYITTQGDSESLMTSSFYGNLPEEEEMRAEHVRAFRKGRGYESVTEIGPNGEKTERTYFYGTDDDKTPFVKAYYAEEGAQKADEHTRFGHSIHGVGIPEKTDFLQKLCTDKIAEEEEEETEKFKIVKAILPTATEAHIDAAQGLGEHVSVGETDLTEETEEATGESSNLEDEEGTVKDKEKEETKKDAIEGWGKPLRLPLPQKNLSRAFEFPGQNISTTSSLSTPSENTDSVSNWGQPMSLPSPGPPGTQNAVAEVLSGKISGTSNKETSRKEKIQVKKSGDSRGSGTNTPNRRSQSPAKSTERRAASAGRVGRSGSNSYIYLDLTYVPHHGNSYYINVEFFKRVRARYYVFSGTEPSKDVYNALLEAKQTWEDKNLEVTIIPTYDTDILGYWVAENEEILAKHKIDLSPSASRCTINLQDHETSCSAYRLEF